MTRLGPKLLLMCLVFFQLGTPRAHAELPDLSIRCWAKSRVDASIVGFANKTLVVEDTYGNVIYGFNTDDCSEEWEVERAHLHLMGARIADGTVFAQFFDEPNEQVDPDDQDALSKLPGVILAIDSANGDILWESASLAGYASGFAATSEAVVFDGAGRLEVFRASDGELLWTKEPMEAGWFTGSPTISGSMVIRNDSPGSEQGSGAFTAFNLYTGEILWEYDVPQRSLSVNVETGSNDSVLIFLTFKTIGDFEARVISVLDPATGADRLDQGDEIAIDAISDGETLFYLTADTPMDQAQLMLKSVNLQTGATRFLVDVDDFGSFVGVTDDSVVVIDDRESESRTTTIHAFNPSDGGQLWSLELDGIATFGQPAYALADGNLMVAHDDRFAIIDLDEGAVQFEAQLPILASDYSISDTGWCPEGDFHNSLQVSERVVALETCTDAVAIIDVL